MQKIIVVTHGKLASGIKNTLEMLVGDASELQVVMQADQGQVKFEEELSACLANKEDEYLVFTDIEGGSPAQTMLKLKYQLQARAIIISGLSLPMLLEAYLLRNTIELQELADKVQLTGQTSIKQLDLVFEASEDDE